MRGVDYQQSGMFSYISAEPRVPEDHPLQAIRLMADAGLKDFISGSRVVPAFLVERAPQLLCQNRRPTPGTSG